MGSYSDTQRALGVLNQRLQTRYAEGEPVRLDIYGQPKLHILSFNPLAYEVYGTFRDRAPHVAGSLALRAFLLQQYSDGSAIIVAGVEAQNQGYGFYMDSCNPSTKQTVESVATVLGTPVKVDFI